MSLSYDWLLKIAAQGEAESARNKALFGKKIQCRKGCTDCRHRLFPITELEAAYISKAIKEMAPEGRLRLRERTRKYIGRPSSPPGQGGYS